jgi:hypothetical protein
MRTVRQRLRPTGRRDSRGEAGRVLIILENEPVCQSHRVCKQINATFPSDLAPSSAPSQENRQSTTTSRQCSESHWRAHQGPPLGRDSYVS